MKIDEISSSKSTNKVSLDRVKDSQQDNRLTKVKQNLEAEEKAQEKSREATKENVEEGIEQLNEAVQTFHEDLQFELHEGSERMMAKLVDLSEHEVIKEMPPKEILDMLGKIKDMVGLILDEKI
ncbi:MAG: flagellar protein FlaG [Bacillota bacterium]